MVMFGYPIKLTQIGPLIVQVGGFGYANGVGPGWMKSPGDLLHSIMVDGLILKEDGVGSQDQDMPNLFTHLLWWHL